MSGYVAAFGKPYSRVFTHPKTVGTIAAFCLNRSYRPSLGCVSNAAIGQHLELHFYKRGSRSQYSHVYNKTQLQVLRLQLRLKCSPNWAYSRIFYKTQLQVPNLRVLLNAALGLKKRNQKYDLESRFQKRSSRSPQGAIAAQYRSCLEMRL